MQRENEADRVVLDGRRTDDGTRCTVVVIRELSGAWAFYPHGIDAFGARLCNDDATTLARAILGAAP